MELKDFVSTTLKEIEAGLASAESSKNSYSVLGRYRATATAGGIAFDLALSSGSTEENASNVGGGLKIKVISAEADKSGKKVSTSESTSRIQFIVNPEEK
jgi:hypothetical protein